MSLPPTYQTDPNLDLVLQRDIDVPPALVWRAWTDPQLLIRWFTPAPWSTVECTIDLRPGGRFHTVMCSPEGQHYPNDGTYLEIVENERLVWTNMVAPGFRPSIPAKAEGHECAEFMFTCILSLEPHGSGCRYTAIALHADADSRARHAAMGFEDGWGKALEQLLAVVKT